MSDKLAAAVEALQEELEMQLAAVADTKRTINALLRRMGKEPLYDGEIEEVHSSTLRADQFYGKPLATAAREYLEIRRNKGAVEAADILQGLKSGGFDFRQTDWREKDYLRMLSISLAKNTSMFHRLPNGTFGLLTWYDKEMLRKADKVAAGTKKPSETSTPEDDAEEPEEATGA